MKACSKIMFFEEYFWLPGTPKLSLSPLLRLIMFIPQVTNIHSKFQLDTMSGSAKTRSKYFSQCYSYRELAGKPVLRYGNICGVFCVHHNNPANSVLTLFCFQ